MIFIKLNKNKLYILQANKCLSTKEILKRSGLSRSGLMQIMNGKRSPRPETIGKLAKALGVEVEFLIEKD